MTPVARVGAAVLLHYARRRRAPARTHPSLDDTHAASPIANWECTRPGALSRRYRMLFVRPPGPFEGRYPSDQKGTGSGNLRLEFWVAAAGTLSPEGSRRGQKFDPLPLQISSRQELERYQSNSNALMNCIMPDKILFDSLDKNGRIHYKILRMVANIRRSIAKL